MMQRCTMLSDVSVSHLQMRRKFRKECYHRVISRASLEITRGRTCATMCAARVRVRVHVGECARRTRWCACVCIECCKTKRLALSRVEFASSIGRSNYQTMMLHKTFWRSDKMTANYSRLSLARYNEYRLNGYRYNSSPNNRILRI